MDLTPQTLHAVEFREARRGGYNTRDVDDFIERIAAAAGQLQDRLREAAARNDAAEAHLQEAQRRIEDLQRRPPPAAAATAPPTPEASETDETLRRTLVLAQRTADATVKEAKQEASRMLEEARKEVEDLRSSADELARAGVEEAREAAEAEVAVLLETRDSLQGDIETLRAHLEAQRDKIRASLNDLRSVVDDPEAFPLLDVPPTSEVDPSMFGAGQPVAASGFEESPPQPERAPLPARDVGRNGRITEPEPTPFVSGSQIAALQEPPSPTPFGGFAPPTEQESPQPPAPPIGFGPDDRGPWMPPELREPREPQSPPAPLLDPLSSAPPPFAEDDDFGMSTETAQPPTEWGRAVFGHEEESGESPYGRGG